MQPVRDSRSRSLLNDSLNLHDITTRLEALKVVADDVHDPQVQDPAVLKTRSTRPGSLIRLRKTSAPKEVPTDDELSLRQNRPRSQSATYVGRRVSSGTPPKFVVNLDELTQQHVPQGLLEQFVEQAMPGEIERTPIQSAEYMRRRSSDAGDSPRVEVELCRKTLHDVEQDKSEKEPLKKLIKKVPEYVVSLTQRVGNPPACFEHNNYGLTPDPQTEIEYVEDKVIVYVGGVKKVFDSKAVFVANNQVFVNKTPAIFADSVLATNHQMGCQTFVVADGCGWGDKAKDAAIFATSTTLKTIDEQVRGTKWKPTTRKIAKIQLSALQKAQEHFTQNGNDVGSTTLTIVTVAAPFLVITSVGDSDVYLLRKGISGKRQCINLTEGSRLGVDDATDPGGRLGYNKAGPDWRNLAIAVVKLEQNDFIIGGSDGVFDNFDPKICGLTPNNFGYEELQWDNSVRILRTLREYKFAKKFIEVVGDSIEEAPHRIISYIAQLTLKTKLLLLEDPKASEPQDDYMNYPGKSDHASFVLFEYQSLRQNRGSDFFK